MAFHFPQTSLELKHVGIPHGESRRKSLSSTTSIPSVTSNITTFSNARWHFSSALHWTLVVTSQQPVTVDGTVDTGLLLSGRRIEEGTGSLLSCLSLAWGLIHQMEKPMADWQQPSTLPPGLLSSTYFISPLSLLFVLLSIILSFPL